MRSNPTLSSPPFCFYTKSIVLVYFRITASKAGELSEKAALDYFLQTSTTEKNIFLLPQLCLAVDIKSTIKLLLSNLSFFWGQKSGLLAQK